MDFHHTIQLRVGNVSLVLYSREATPWDSIRIQKHLSGCTGSEASVTFVKELIDKCSEEHEICRVPADTVLSTRVLDIGDLKSQELTESITLFDTMQHRAPYACLSHCWGAVHTITTTRDNIQSNKEGMRIASLPRTFQDAIDFTRRLGIRYLWIDSLCIIQDDEEDWRREAAQMCDLYRNCVICIASTNSSDDRGGCYNYQPIRTVRFSSNTYGKCKTESSPWEVFVRTPLKHWALSDTPFGNRDNTGILRTRGWVYQERMLAPRFLNFLEQEVACECRLGSRCECGCQCDLMTMGAKKSEFTKAVTEGNIDSLAFEWRQMIGSYTSLKLTYQQDRLPAIAGIAQRFQEIRGSTYHAGIWRDTAVVDLTWEVWHHSASWKERGKNTYARVDGVPSWSWGCVATMIFYDWAMRDTSEKLCEVIDIGFKGLIPQGDPCGLSNHRLKIYGFILSATLRYKDIGTWCNLEIPNCKDQVNFGNDVVFGIQGPSYIPSGDLVYCLLLLKDDFHYKCLVLQKLDNEEDLYRRIGIVRHKENIFVQGAEKKVVSIV
ncbi:HET-domain-containing protein [Zopfia rhizophila CBS 207.26]|uniref:HET-domain-containing protein n=1 Tax=Zopfia rhizophila CBS 207.26 TaxID=1314779 RepID=A0A6A6DJS0_9PEZI|nr:HET-domain-containing protein [Zopfia rhizophila CBS 207.26]